MFFKDNVCSCCRSSINFTNFKIRYKDSFQNLIQQKLIKLNPLYMDSMLQHSPKYFKNEIYYLKLLIIQNNLSKMK